MSLKDPNELGRIAELVNSKSISSSIDFFFGRGELSQVVDQDESAFAADARAADCRPLGRVD